jgi:hypothetical protein
MRLATAGLEIWSRMQHGNISGKKKRANKITKLRELLCEQKQRLNEGMTVYTERKIYSKLYGEQTRHFHAIIGWKSLEDSVAQFGPTSPFTALKPKYKIFFSFPFLSNSLFFFFSTQFGWH